MGEYPLIWGKSYGDFMEGNETKYETLIFKKCDLSWDMDEIYTNGNVTNELYWIV